MKKFNLCALAASTLLAMSCGLLGGSGLGSGNNRTYVFNNLPRTVGELQALPQADMTDPYAVAALTIVAFTNYEDNNGECIKMLNYLKGPESVSNYDVQFYRDRLAGKQYKIWSFFLGATPGNNYTPSKPYKITVSSNPYSFQEENWAIMYVTSGGADNPRQIKLRKKPSTGQWFLNDVLCLGDIRLPASEDKWR